MRPHSINCYAFSKLWHICNTIDLRVRDINFINKQAEAWLYADLRRKNTEELALYREPVNGGLGLYHVQQRALANQINWKLLATHHSEGTSITMPCTSISSWK